ncbi:MAG: hypothetical protein M0006_07305 [Magnetospirillum sp.]|nr:hypothetical protein [Magnetospirillum sp.]
MTDDPRFPEEKTTPLATLAAPWGREISLQGVEHESGLKILRVRIKEGRARFTILDLDAPTAKAWGEAMMTWAKTAES